MGTRFRLFLAFLAGMFVHASGIPLARAAADEVVALVNGVPILAEALVEYGKKLTPEDGARLSLDQKQQVLDHLIEEELLYEQALKQGLDKDPMVKKVMVNALLRRKVYSTVHNTDFNDPMLQAYFEEHRQEFTVPEKVDIRRILIKTTAPTDAEAKDRAEKIRRELLRHPDQFAEYAQKYSEDPYRRRGGDVGFVAREGKPGLDPMIVEKAFSMKEGQLSEIFVTADGWNIVQVPSRRAEVERTFQQMKGTVLRKMKNEKMKGLYDDYVAKLRSAAQVTIDPRTLTALVVEPNRSFPSLPSSNESGSEESEEHHEEIEQ